MQENMLEGKTAIAKRNYSLTIVSPMAMHGAYPRGAAEFRTASMKGILRYWWRSLQLEPNNKNLLSEEVLLFGGTETDNMRKSPVSFSLIQQVKGEKQENLLPHRTGDRNDPKQTHVKSSVIPENERIDIHMHVMKVNERKLELYEKYMNYILHLTGMGQRSRRGYGACQWENHQWGTVSDFAESLKKSLTGLGFENEFSWNEAGPCLVKRKSSVRVAHPVLGAVYIGSGDSSIRKILTNFGVASHEVNPPGTLGSAKPRWASPLWCTIRQIGSLYYPIITELHTNGSNIRDKAVYARERDQFLRRLGVKL
ncbi:type III-B CRISPR module RAMP protein Cmr1 [Bacillus sp. DTU_2020_1000418_1_SI_GHA_SEK_038]|uniref:type III-B CRISPR module RAMP protein Cmr1 n=1 Tax=Bacillus sp. DTU_2020_1000418_1_SI_GHA_SEK_038 TaxID=3077585 RepID=UPI0028EA01BF|nr:type III-B CRISPR module RAMP protein Cmr1 [Bacillus sp. DTU_2020_1000418_1_SI_GHA_SEK_038]WNS77430.1 type III-B CRISPR module RAMP protein Cmr1 [Bacillus sp. DTU_2020_1000418_1_SI_GHA_SEK_038]